VSNDAIIAGAHSNCFYIYYCRCTVGLGLVADSAPLSTVCMAIYCWCTKQRFIVNPCWVTFMLWK